MATSKQSASGGTALRPFQNESQSLEIGDLTIENRVDRVECYGSIQFTKDKAGLASALALKAVIDAVVDALGKEDLPEHITEVEPQKVRNPFRE